MWMEQKIIPMVGRTFNTHIFMSSTPLKGASGHKQTNHVRAGFTRSCTYPNRVSAAAIGCLIFLHPPKEKVEVQ